MRLKVIACKVFCREISYLTYNSKHMVDVTYLRQGYHNTPEKLNAILQGMLDSLDAGDDMFSCQPVYGEDFDAILLGYGLCSNALVGLKSKRYRLVIPRAHDCVTLFLGSKEKYHQYFHQNSGGIYWYTGGWIENTPMPGQERVDSMRNEYIEKYGEDNADYLMEMEQGWLKEYELCTFVDWKELDNERFIDYTRQCARYLDWKVDVLQGESSLMAKFLSGEWNHEDFLVLEPGQEIVQSFDETIIKAR